jgi:hypothetical protein
MVASKGQKGRKIGRNKPACESYRRQDKQAKNAALRQVKHQKTIAKMRARTERLYPDLAVKSEHP